MSEAEAVDLTSILWSGYRMGAGPDVVALLRELPWESADEKAVFWRTLPLPLRAWITLEVQKAIAAS